MNGFKRISTRTVFSVLIATFFVVMSYPASGDTTIDGYTFSDDSTDLHMNIYFSEYDRGVDFSISLYGYGDFTGYRLSQQYKYDFTLDGITCAVIREHTDIPPYGGTSPDVDVHDIYYYYAKDIDDNIHVLLTAYYSGGESVGWRYTDLPEGTTTLKYPADPTPGQEVFFGHVEETGKQVGDFSGCVTIANEDLPWTEEPITEYLLPASGILALSYNQNGGINGYSFDGGAPEYAEEEQGTWDKWVDDHCFISACSP